MTVCELVVYNSTIPSGQGTFLEHLMNVQVTREAVCGISVDITDSIAININYDIITADFKDSVLACTIEDSLEINLQEDNIGVNI